MRRSFSIVVLLALLTVPLGSGQAQEDDAPRDEILEHANEAWTGDLDGMTERGFVRILTVHNPLLFQFDGPQQRELIPLDIVRKETLALLGSEFKVDFPAAKQLDGDWSVGGIEAAAERLLSDPEVDVILANGLVSSHVLAAKKVLKKPVIATVIADPVFSAPF